MTQSHHDRALDGPRASDTELVQYEPGRADDTTSEVSLELDYPFVCFQTTIIYHTT